MSKHDYLASVSDIYEINCKKLGGCFRLIATEKPKEPIAYLINTTGQFGVDALSKIADLCDDLIISAPTVLTAPKEPPKKAPAVKFQRRGSVGS